RELACLLPRFAETEHAYALDVHELSKPEGAQLAAVTGGFDTAKGKARIGCDHSIHEDGARLELSSEIVRFPCVRGPDRGAEPETRIVRDPNGIFRVARAKHRSNRSKELVA